ncbi:hypothetical protein FPQ18DRAFT_389504 [Pyronema domesticum]|uniref:Uncharacterized protein n=1 Tax=Pyronema omphalodes (strain CBS 100304) TaxID=1076935 RepID=U4LTS9_PYROM|nr:hypothetical protein FPQ18DRAFT_389504 [Pyronema domesticum]CCX31056.1 Similar to hypothetical protein SCHCODRAFT_238799 [Schizophyllum commune H4-8]; acc. no. XP_003026071 [Pyronema omphalodes CBS 100304]
MAAYTLPSGQKVIFLYEDRDQSYKGRGIEDHLKVLECFAAIWNSNYPDKCGRFPSLSATNAWPAGAIVVSSGHHKSNHSIGEDQHITAYVCSEAGWNSVPRRSNACVHIYSMDEDVSMGFMGYWIKNSNSNNFKSKLVLEKLQRALENERKMPPNY